MQRRPPEALQLYSKYYFYHEKGVKEFSKITFGVVRSPIIFNISFSFNHHLISLAFLPPGHSHLFYDPSLCIFSLLAFPFCYIESHDYHMTEIRYFLNKKIFLNFELSLVSWDTNYRYFVRSHIKNALFLPIRGHLSKKKNLEVRRDLVELPLRA